MGEKGEGSGGDGGGKWGEWGRELGMWYPPVHPLISNETYRSNQINFIDIESSNRTVTSHM